MTKPKDEKSWDGKMKEVAGKINPDKKANKEILRTNDDTGQKMTFS